MKSDLADTTTLPPYSKVSIKSTVRLAVQASDFGSVLYV